MAPKALNSDVFCTQHLHVQNTSRIQDKKVNPILFMINVSQVQGRGHQHQLLVPGQPIPPPVEACVLVRRASLRLAE